MTTWSDAEQEWRSAPSDPDSPLACLDCGRTVGNAWTGPIRQGLHDRCYAERNGLDGDREVLGIAAGAP